MNRSPRMHLVLDAGVRTVGGGRVLLSVSPLRALRLNEAERRLVGRWTAGEPVGSTTVERRLARRMLDAGMAHPSWDQAALDGADVTVVVPVKDRHTELARLLAALGDVAAVLVVDDGSTPPIRDAAIRHERAKGPAAARNAGWRRASTELVAFVDSDCLPEPGWLDQLLPHFTDPQVAAVAPRIASTAGPSLLARYETARSPHDLGPAPAPVRPRTAVSYVSTTALVVRRTALEAVDGLRDDLRFGEDLDLVWRLVGQGWTVRYEPAALATHLPRTRLVEWARQRFAYGTTDAPLLARHPGSMAPLTASPWSVAVWGLVVAGRPQFAALLAGSTAALTARQLGEVAVSPGEGLRLAADGHVSAGRSLMGAALRAWWPATATAALLSPHARRAVAAGTVACYLDEWRRQRPDLGPIPWCTLRLLDDLAYGFGVWAGCARHRTIAPLIPDLHGWPGLAQRR